MEDLSDTQEFEVDESYIGDKPPEEIVSPDGETTSILLEDELAPATENGEWFQNLAEILPEDDLDRLADAYLELIDKDMLDRKDRDKIQAEGIKKTGIGEPAPGGADFEGASRVTHPILAESYIDFAASAIKELFPPNGPVKIKIDGKPNKQKMDKARRKSDFMNWQLIREIPSYRPELERLLTQLPVGGSQYMKIYWDEAKGHPEAEFVPIDDIILPYHAKNFFDVSRKFHKMNLSNSTYQSRVETGQYVDFSLPEAYSPSLDQTESSKATDKIEGKRSTYIGETEERLVFEGCVYETIDDKQAPEGKAVPYLITIDEQSRKVLALYRNWDEDDEKCREIDYLVDWTFIPWRGIFGLSLEQCLAGLPDTLTGALRALLDSALISNTQGGIKLKGTPGGASISVSPTQITEVDAMGQDDIRKIYMPIPFNQPSTVLFQLLGYCSEAAKSVVGTAEEKVADGGANMPVGTTLALIEQGAKVFSAIHARIHDSQRRCLEILHRLNRDHLPDGKVMFGTDKDDYITREDFAGSMDVRPVSDPNIFSETQRFAQIQFAVQLATQNQAMAQTNPALANIFDMRELYGRALELAKVPDYEEFLPEIPKAQALNPVDENVALVLGKPVKAYAGQNHEAHIQILLDFAKNPLFGANPIIAAKFLPGAMNHLTDHLLVWYEEMMKRDAAINANKKPDDVDWDNDPEASIMLAKSTDVIDKAAEISFQQIPMIIAKGMQSLQALTPKPPMDPMVEVAQQDVKNKHDASMAKLSSDDKKTMMTLQQKRDETAQKAKEADQEYGFKLQQLGVTTQTEMEKAQLQSQTELAKTLHKNTSDERVAAHKIGVDALIAHHEINTNATIKKEENKND